ncbi:MAG: hypothetical protein BAJALOKI1v1_1750007 [Promethearchaeota archaeon]|nr:MAG: hypothetical protein BAJALOKI1v1_1750007 [Candidatus Lokiarchaeota archaeon]
MLKILTFKNIVRFDQEEINSLLNEVGSEEFVNAIMKEYPDYYNLRGTEIKNLSLSQRESIKKLLHKELR